MKEIETCWGTQTQIECNIKMAVQDVRRDRICFDCRHVHEPYQFIRNVSLPDSQEVFWFL
jgi:hypothetical protein